LPYGCGIIVFTTTGPVLPLDEARHQLGELQEIGNAKHRAPLPDDDLWIGCDDVGPLRRHRAKVLLVEAQKEPPPVPVVPLTDADELPPAEWVKRVGHAHKARARVRRACSSW
jgi:hypothetical protein